MSSAKKKSSFVKKRLPNGLRCIVVPTKNTQAITTLVLVKTGSKYETKRTNGVSHFLEHLFFKGTKNRPNPEDIARELDRMGAQFNAFTLRETTGYWIKSAQKHFTQALDIMADILLNPLLKNEELNRERGVILQELSMYEDMPQRKVFDVWEELLYGDQPAGWPIGGTEKSVKNISRKDVATYRNRQYVGANTVIVIAGNVDPKQVIKQVSSAFKTFKKGNPKKKKRVIEDQKRPKTAVFKKDTEQTHLVIGTRAFDMYHEDRWPLTVLSTILGGTMSSRLFIEVRERRGLAYYVQAGTEEYTDSGYFLARAGVRHDALEEASRTILDQLADIARNGPARREVDFAKDNLRGSLAISFESSDSLAQFYGSRELFYNKITTPQDLFQKIEAVGEDDVARVARDLFRPHAMNMAVVGPHDKKNLSQFFSSYTKQFSQK